MNRLRFYIFSFLVIAAACTQSNKKAFSIKISHFAGAAGMTRIYFINQNELHLSTDCDFKDCQEQVVYKREFTKNETANIANFISSLHLDTLKASYETPNIDDGLVTRIVITNESSASKTSTFSNYRTSVTDTLFRYIDNLILVTKFKFYKWGSE